MELLTEKKVKLMVPLVMTSVDRYIIYGELSLNTHHLLVVNNNAS